MPAPSQTFVVREPIGVCGQIIPWNYPLLMAAWKLAPALAAGNVCVLKPSELTPLTALWLARLIDDVGFPHGVVSVVPGAGPTVGAALAESHLVDKIAFTGSVPTGQSIMRAAAGNVKKISLELGGKSPNIVFADADFDTAVDYALFGIYANAGQVCSAGSRLLLERSVYDKFMARLIARAKQIVVGDGFDPKTEMGPLVAERQRDRVERYIQSGIDEGATLATGGGRPAGAPADGFYIEPTIFTDTKPGMRIVREEIFGPVISRGADLRRRKRRRSKLANDSARTASRARSSRTTERARTASSASCVPASRGSTRTTRRTTRRHGAATSSRASGANSARTASTRTPKIKQINVNLAVEPSGWFKDDGGAG